MKTSFCTTSILRFLLTPLREGRRSRFSAGRTAFPISTHAPAGGATELLDSSKYLTTISTHAPAGGATDGTDATKVVPRRISTHAPAGGATIWRRGRSRQICHFYSRPCGRGDIRRYGPAHSAGNFYSRPCGRGDTAALRCRSCKKISTHAPAGGATRYNAADPGTGRDFYSRPCGRGDLAVFQLNAGQIGISTHAPAGGATFVPDIEANVTGISTHAPAGGAT